MCKFFSEKVVEILKFIQYLNSKIMESTLNQRVNKILNVNKISVNKFCTIVGIPQTTLSKQLTAGCNGVSSVTLLAILSYFPNVSAEWLMRGEGEMFKSSSQIIGDHINGNGNIGHGATINNVTNEENSNLKVEVKYLKEQVEDLRKDKELLTKLLTK